MDNPGSTIFKTNHCFFVAAILQWMANWGVSWKEYKLLNVTVSQVGVTVLLNIAILYPNSRFLKSDSDNFRMPLFMKYNFAES